jgi:hypothetical protein
MHQVSTEDSPILHVCIKKMLDIDLTILVLCYACTPDDDRLRG